MENNIKEYVTIKFLIFLNVLYQFYVKKREIFYLYLLKKQIFFNIV